MSYSKDLLRRHTLQDRIRLHQLIASGMCEADAINRVFPTCDGRGRRINSNRMAKLRLWAERGLWPVSETDLEEAGLREKTTGDQRFERLRHIIRKRSQPESYLEIRQKHARTVPLSFRLPAHLAAELKKLEGTRTGHVVAALTNYIADRLGPA
ncbi:MAG: hypothetical protein ACLPVO_11480 [Desulfomonilaceae bacterium]